MTALACDWPSAGAGTDMQPRGGSTSRSEDVDLLRSENSPEVACILMKLPARGMDLVFAGGITCVCVCGVFEINKSTRRGGGRTELGGF